MADDLREWLESLDLGKYADLFSENEVGLRDLPLSCEVGSWWPVAKRRIGRSLSAPSSGELADRTDRRLDGLFAMKALHHEFGRLLT